MSSNIEIIRICEFCNNEFTAKTTVTKLCSAKCRKANYKKKQRIEKIEKSNIETKQIKNRSIISIKEKEFLSVREVALLLGCSIRTAYRLIDTGTLKGFNIAERMTRVKRSEINKLLDQQLPINQYKKEFDLTECYTIKEVLEQFTISETALQNLIKRENIPKIKKGWYSYVPKQLIEKHLS
jgi:excisionase family DNA binding protein